MTKTTIPYVVSFSGLIGSGKDAAAQYLINTHGFVRMSYATTLKDAVSVIFGWDRTLLDGLTDESRVWREQIDLWWADRLNISHLTPRWVLQYIGTNVLRQHFHDDIWIASMERKLQYMEAPVVITDARFANEIESVKKVGGTTVQILRLPLPHWYAYAINLDNASSVYLQEQNIHPSEYSHICLQYDHIIENNSTIEDLYRNVDLIVSGRY
jgi:hypothetical protein